MDTIQLLGSTLGLGFVAGIRLYATVLAIGAAIRFGWIHLLAGQEHLKILAEPAVMAVAGAAFLIELVSDKIPWVDSLWDSFHTFIRPIGAALLAAAALGSIDPALKVVLIILCGGVAFSSHSSKAATRLFVNHSPEPFTNIGLSVGEDLLALFGVWLSLQHPMVALVFVLIFLSIFAWVSPKVFRLIRLQLVALWSWLNRGNRTRSSGPPPPTSWEGVKPAVADAVRVIVRNAGPLPATYVTGMRYLKTAALPFGIRCAATKRIKGLRNSIGYLSLADGALIFVTRRLFKYRVHRIDIGDIDHAEWKRGLLMNRFILRTSAGENAFYVFKDVDIGTTAA